MEMKEEIEKAAAKFDGSMDCVGCFIGGAEWADQHPRKGLVDIEKACKNLKSVCTIILCFKEDCIVKRLLKRLLKISKSIWRGKRYEDVAMSAHDKF